MSKKTFLDHLGMKHKEDLPQYKGTFLKKRQWELAAAVLFTSSKVLKDISERMTTKPLHLCKQLRILEKIK